MTTILVVDDHASLRNEVVRLVSGADDLTVVGEAESGEDAVRKSRSLRPDLVLMDIVLPRMNGVEATSEILGELPDTVVVVLSGYSNPGLVRKMFDLGVRGYVRKDRAFEELLEAIAQVLGGKRYVGSGIAVDQA